MAHANLDFLPSTRWSQVADAARGHRGALQWLCERYWAPLYGYARRRGLIAADAEEAVQSYLERLVRTDALVGADPARGRFRAYLLVGFKNHLSNRRSSASAQRRGGHAPHVPLDAGPVERWLDAHPDVSPDELYDRQWAHQCASLALERLSAQEPPERFAVLAPHLLEDAGSLREAARRLGIKDTAARVALHRLRKKFGLALREVVAETLLPSEDVEAELRHLLQALG